MPISKEAILQQADARGVEFIRLQFSDILGIAKNITIPRRELERALDNEITFDGSSVEGFTRIQESDMCLHPDCETFTVLPWHSDHPVARLICDIHTADGRPFAGDPRYALRRAVAKAAQAGYTMMAGPEAEFFLFRTDPEGRPTLTTNDEGGYFDLAPVDRGKEARRDIVLALEEMGFAVEASHHEVARGQHEIDFHYAEALTAADRLATFKIVTRAVAQQHGLHATFMPKPIAGVNGSGLHIHLSLLRDGENVFRDPGAQSGLSQTALWFIGGVMRHARGMTAVTNQLVNSYKRLIPGYEAPVYLTWSAANRSALIRVPTGRAGQTRLEIRHPDPACNPYLALAVILSAGLDGLAKRIQPPPPVQKNIYALSPAERTADGIESLPGSLSEALEELSRDEVMTEALGSHILSHFLAAKKMEWEIYRSQVHAWELAQYLKVY